MYDSDELRALAEGALKAESGSSASKLRQVMTPETVLALLDEIEAMREMLARIPQTPQQMINFIGSNFNSQSPFDDDGKLCGDLSMVTYSLSVHDLLSAFSWADLDRYAIDAARTKGGDA